MGEVNINLAQIDRIRLDEQAGDPANPAAGYGYLYAKAGGVYFKQDDGTVIGPFGVPYTEGARVSNSGDQQIADGVVEALTFDTELYDTDNIHSLIANTDRLTCKTAGIYNIWGIIGWEANATGRRYHCIALNGNGFAERIAMTGGDWDDAVLSGFFHVQCTYELDVDDYVTLLAFQDTGGNLDSITSSGTYDWSPLFGMNRIG